MDLMRSSEDSVVATSSHNPASRSAKKRRRRSGVPRVGFATRRRSDSRYLNPNCALVDDVRNLRNHSAMHKAAEQALMRRDPTLRQLIKTHGPCPLAPRRDHFVMLCKAIVSQQLSTKAAATIFGRFRDLFDRRRPTPQGVLALPFETLRSVGLSNQKTGYMIDLAEKFDKGGVPRRMASLSDDQIIDVLTGIKGVGVWTAQMFLMFVMVRPDVWPVDDLGIRKAARQLYGFKTLPDAKKLNRLAQPWRPYRTVAAWYFWRSLDNAPID